MSISTWAAGMNCKYQNTILVKSVSCKYMLRQLKAELADNHIGVFSGWYQNWTHVLKYSNSSGFMYWYLQCFSQNELLKAEQHFFDSVTPYIRPKAIFFHTIFSQHTQNSQSSHKRPVQSIWALRRCFWKRNNVIVKWHENRTHPFLSSLSVRQRATCLFLLN